MTFTTLAKRMELGFVLTVKKRMDFFLFLPGGRGRFFLDIAGRRTSQEISLA